MKRKDVRGIMPAVLFGVAVVSVLASVSVFGEPLAKAKRGDWPMWGGSPDRNMVSGERGIATDWDAKSKKNIRYYNFFSYANILVLSRDVKSKHFCQIGQVERLALKRERNLSPRRAASK